MLYLFWYIRFIKLAGQILWNVQVLQQSMKFGLRHKPRELRSTSCLWIWRIWEARWSPTTLSLGCSSLAKWQVASGLACTKRRSHTVRLFSVGMGERKGCTPNKAKNTTWIGSYNLGRVSRDTIWVHEEDRRRFSQEVEQMYHWEYR